MRSLKKLLSYSEEKVDRELQGIAAENGYRVFAKVRLADVFRVDASGLQNTLYSFSLKSHFDFVASKEDNIPLFAVEFDDRSHRARIQILRDKKKDSICNYFEFPILRINTRHIIPKYNKASLLKWIISAWELKNAFEDAQERGFVPIDEPFDPTSLIHPGKTPEEIYPHSISRASRLRILKLYELGQIPTKFTCGIVFMDGKGNYHGIEWVDVADDRVVFVTSAMRKQLFPIYLGDLFRELMMVPLCESLDDYLKGNCGSSTPQLVARTVRAMQEKFEFAGCHGAPTCVTVSLASD